MDASMASTSKFQTPVMQAFIRGTSASNNKQLPTTATTNQKTSKQGLPAHHQMEQLMLRDDGTFMADRESSGEILFLMNSKEET